MERRKLPREPFLARAPRATHPATAPLRDHSDNLLEAGWSWGCVSAVDSNGRTIFVADALRGDRKRFVVRADEKLTAFVEKSPSRAGTPRQRVLSAKLSFCRNLFYLVVA
jgi:hypothetical protein